MKAKPFFQLILLLVLIGLLVTILHYRSPYSYIASNEATAIAQLKVIEKAQKTFLKDDHYKINKKVYANPKNGRGISDLYEIGYDGTNATPNAHKTLDRTVASADDSNPNPIPKGGYFVRDLKCNDYTKQFAAVAYPAFYIAKKRYILGIKVEHANCGRNVFVLNETGAIYQIDARELYPDIKTGDKIAPPDKHPTDEELKKWIPAER